MESHNFERVPEVNLNEISGLDESFINDAASLVSEHSWGHEYPVSPIDEIRLAEFRIGAFDNDTLIGFGSVGRSFSPDAIDNGELWLGHAVVAPTYRNKGIFKKLYDSQIAYASSHKGRVLSCTDNPVVEKFFLENGWKELRKTKDEASDVVTVFEYVPQDADRS